MKQIRYGVFETNSSSVHSIAIPREKMLDIPSVVTVHPMEFGWDNKQYKDVNSKASYLFISILYYIRGHAELEDDVNMNIALTTMVDRFNSLFANYNVKVENKIKFKVVKYEKFCYIDMTDSYIDHGNDNPSFVKRILEDDDYFANFMFNPNTIIMTGNDNDGSCDNQVFDDSYEVVQKGN